MRNWIKLWRDWVMREIPWPFHRIGCPQLQGLHVSYEKAGLLVRHQPVPWNADVVWVEALLRFPAGPAKTKANFQLRIPGQPPLTAVTLHRHEDHDVFRLQFRLPPLQQSTTVELLWGSYGLGQALIPLLSANDFVDNLQVQAPTVLVRLADYTVPCQAFLGVQGRGLIASGMLVCPTSLAPLLDLDLAVEFIDRKSGELQRIPVRMNGSQLTGNHAIVSVAAPKRPRRLGLWVVQWTLSGKVLARTEVRILSQRVLKRSLHLADSRYVHQDPKGVSVLTRQLPTLAHGGRVGPCFLVANREPGLAALCPLEVRIRHRNQPVPTVLPTQEMLVTDGPSLFLPGTVRVEDLADITAFEVFSKGQLLGLLSTCPAPVANFTSEGGFKPPEEFTWNPAAEEELSDRLGKLLELPME